MERLLRIREDIVSALDPVEPEEVHASAAEGRWLAAPALARVAAPPHTCSAMDGYAVRAADIDRPVALPIVVTVYAGDVPATPLRAGEAARIFTGATLPEGADTVVREEAVRLEGERARFSAPGLPGENVRRAGEDVAAGGEALGAGVRIGGRQMALLEAVGVARLAVRRRPRVIVLSTGDEVVSGRTPDSNGAAVASLVRAAGALVERRRVRDEAEEVEAAISEAVQGADLVLTIGGVSIGARDLVPAALERLGADVRVHGVPMKPGKPFLFALAGAVPVLGLPGSPSACLVAFEVFARPALLRRCGAARTGRPALPVRLAEAVEGRPGRARLLWAALEPDGRARPIGRDAAQIRGPALADLLLCLPSDTGSLAAGAEVTAWLLAE